VTAVPKAVFILHIDNYRLMTVVSSHEKIRLPDSPPDRTFDETGKPRVVMTMCTLDPFVGILFPGKI
jgi:hypothetical protein